MRAKRFEDLYFWQRARDLAKAVYRIADEGQFGSDNAFKDQLRQAGMSPMGEIAFGFAQGDVEDFRDYLDVARGDLMRLKSLAYLAKEMGYLDEKQVEEIIIGIQEVERLMTGFIRGMRSRRRGISHHEEHLTEHTEEHYQESRDNNRDMQPDESIERSYDDVSSSSGEE